ncbi:hypothetical protein FHX42_003034 [Saccharopolyspora lacisalsi]|uniref:DUF4192 domain-containing protein n=1 Tax=Halosaccharopolyspora lacisalsi TaxID=1000566 RepID=A0A839E423_9PSEU|nr:DUF4192 domain-containing protein [Halosaccharopolyspora lacisalsi]MBA8825668.1 hypothetical protein [Halosaccharopolyspora lacisalsi]
MTTTPLHSTITLTDPGEVLAAVPHMVGFRPTDSIVFIVVDRQAQRLGMTLRVDLPPLDRVNDFVEHVVHGPMGNQHVDAVIMAVVGGSSGDSATEGAPDVAGPGEAASPPASTPPCSELVGMLRDEFGDMGSPVLHAVWTPRIRAESPWWCYGDGRTGKVPDPDTSPLAAAMAVAGVVTFESREDLAALLTPEGEESIARRSARLDAMYEDIEQERVCAGGSPEADVRIVLAAIRRTADGAALTEEDMLRVLIALSDARVRDLALGTCRTSLATAAEQLWITLVRRAPAPEVADVAALLAFSAYVRGDGALAGIALERVEESRPEHSLGTLLRKALGAGLPPSDLEVAIVDAARDAQLLIDEDGAR